MKLEVLHEGHVVHTVVVDGRPITVGRSPTNTVVLTDPGVSSHHALLAWENRRLVLRDLGSTNGTRVGGHVVVNPHPVDVGDEMAFGPTARVRIAASEGPRLPAPEVQDTRQPTEDMLPYRVTVDPISFRAELADSARTVQFKAGNQVSLLQALTQATGWLSDEDAAAAVWGQAHHRGGANNLNVLVHRIRKRAEDGGLSRWFIERRDGALRLRVAEARIVRPDHQ